MQAEQTVSEMALEVLVRQAKTLAKRSGLPLDEALVEVLNTEPGCQLWELAEGPHRHEKASQWQAGLIGERLRMERAKGEEAHTKYVELLEKEFVRLRG